MFIARRTPNTLGPSVQALQDPNGILSPYLDMSSLSQHAVTLHANFQNYQMMGALERGASDLAGGSEGGALPVAAVSARIAAGEQQLAALCCHICGWGVVLYRHSCWGISSRGGSRRTAAYMLSQPDHACLKNAMSCNCSMHVYNF